MTERTAHGGATSTFRAGEGRGNGALGTPAPARGVRQERTEGESPAGADDMTSEERLAEIGELTTELAEAARRLEVLAKQRGVLVDAEMRLCPAGAVPRLQRALGGVKRDWVYKVRDKGRK